MSQQHWRNDIRMGWLVTDQPEPDGWLYGVRNSDGRTVEASDRQGLLGRMMAADCVKTWRDSPDPELPAELR